MERELEAAIQRYEQSLPAFAADWLQGIVDAVRAGDVKLTSIEASTYESEQPEGDGEYSLTLRLVAPKRPHVCDREGTAA